MRAAIAIAISLIPVLLSAQDGELLSGKELREFLGPVPADAITWRKLRSVDFDVYYGSPNPPLSGDIGFYLGGHPSFTPEPDSKVVRGKLGIFPVEWHRAVASDGSVRQQSVIKLDDYWRVDIWVSAKQQTDIDRLLAVVAQLPTFTKKPKPVSET